MNVGEQIKQIKHQKWPFFKLFQAHGAHVKKAPSALGGVTGPGWWPAAYYNIPKTYFGLENEAFFIWDKYSHLVICLRLMEPHSKDDKLTDSRGVHRLLSVWGSESFQKKKKQCNFWYLIMQQKDRTGLSAMELSRKISKE